MQTAWHLEGTTTQIQLRVRRRYVRRATGFHHRNTLSWLCNTDRHFEAQRLVVRLPLLSLLGTFSMAVNLKREDERDETTGISASCEAV